MAKEIRHTVEAGFFEKWKDGDISITELQKISKLLIERVSEIRTELEATTKDEIEEYKAIDEDRKANLKEWSDLGILQRMVNVGERKYARHQEYLTEFYTSKTRLVALEFAKKLAAKVFNELGKMDADISAFGMKINEAINETERLVTAQRKVNKGLEDMKGAIIEVSEDETMSEFEQELRCDKIEMPIIARQLRDCILPEEFVNFGRLAADISIDDITDAFDIKLSEIVKARHDEKADSDKKVLGLNILTQLQQKLRTDDDIKAFATKIVSQSGVFVQLNTDQIQLHLRNNEGNLSPTNPASINKKAILVSIPSPDDNPGLKKFADKLEAAFKNSFNQSTARTTITVNRKSLRKDELSIITVQYCFPIRAIDWMGDYKKRYERFLNTGNLATDQANAICFIVKATVHNSHLSLHEAMKKSGQQKRLTEHSKQHSSHRPLNLCTASPASSNTALCSATGSTADGTAGSSSRCRNPSTSSRCSRSTTIYSTNARPSDSPLLEYQRSELWTIRLGYLQTDGCQQAVYRAEHGMDGRNASMGTSRTGRDTEASLCSSHATCHASNTRRRNTSSNARRMPPTM